MERKKRRQQLQEPLQQLSFDGLETLVTPEIVLDRCRVLTSPTYVKKGKGYVWDCLVHTLPVLFDLDQDKDYQLHASTYAKEANKAKIKPGDLIAACGIPSTQELILQDGTPQTIYHLSVVKLTVIDRAPLPQQGTIFDAKPQQ